jgi:hypothetical protein
MSSDTSKKSKGQPPGYRSHKEGSRKGKVHELFDKQGPEAAWTLGLKLKLKQGTLRSWFAAWAKATGKKAKPISVAKTKKAAAEKKLTNSSQEVTTPPSAEAAVAT